MPVDLVMGDLRAVEKSTISANDFVAIQQSRIAGAYELVRDRLRVVAERRKEVYDQSIRPKRFEPGDTGLVFLSKTVREKVTEVAILLYRPLHDCGTSFVGQLPDSKVTQKNAAFVVHVDKLKKHYAQTRERRRTACRGVNGCRTMLVTGFVLLLQVPR